MRYLVSIITAAIFFGVGDVKVYAGNSYADLYLTSRGYRPVEDSYSLKPLSARSTEKNGLPDNPSYRDWCVNTFKNGEQIYEAYKEIAFGIDYQAEPSKTDFWQTPLETLQSKVGDCEDSIFLFFSQLSQLDIDGDIVWGWVVDKERSVAFAHVWYQLFDKHGMPYVVEGFSKEWNGIIPAGMVQRLEERVPTLALRHDQINTVVDEMLPKFTEAFEEQQFSWVLYLNNSTQAREIFQKLEVMVSRYREQLRQQS